MYNRIKKSNILVIIILVLFLCNGINAQKLSLRLDLDTNVFLEAQSIWATVVLKNEGKDTAVVQPFIMTHDQNGIEYILKDEHDIQLSKTVGMTSDDFGMTSDVIIIPNDSLFNIYEISGVFGNSEYRKSPVYAPVYLSTLAYLIPGKYKLQAYVHTGKEKLYSNNIEFTVVKPTGSELKALQTLRAIELEQLGKYDHVTIEKCENFIRNFPKSIYTPQAFYLPISLLKYSKHFDKERAKKLILKLINEFPNDGSSVIELTYLINTSSEAEKEVILKTIIQKHPHTKLSLYWERLVNEQKRQKTIKKY